MSKRAGSLLLASSPSNHWMHDEGQGWGHCLLSAYVGGRQMLSPLIL